MLTNCCSSSLSLQPQRCVTLLCLSGSVRSCAIRRLDRSVGDSRKTLSVRSLLQACVSYLGGLANHHRLHREIYLGPPLKTSRDAALDALEVGAARRSRRFHQAAIKPAG